MFNNNGHKKVVSHFVAHSVDFLDVGEYHLGVDSVVRDHSVHVLSGQKVGDASVASEKLPNIVWKQSTKNHKKSPTNCQLFIKLENNFFCLCSLTYILAAFQKLAKKSQPG